MKRSFSPPLNTILKNTYGFCSFVSSPTPKDREDYLKVCEWTKRNDLPFTPRVPVLYERKLSKTTSLMIEGTVMYSETGLSLGYRYDFYKVRYFGKSEPNDIKIYCQNVSRKELLQRLTKFSFLEKEKEHVSF